MALFENPFKINPNESAYAGGKKHFTDVIKNEGAGDLLFWKCPMEDFNTGSTLVVMPGESAIFIKGGEIQQVFENGTYTLTTENYPFISRLRNAFSGGISTFNCVIYFFRKAVSVELLWGTATPIQVRDKLLGIATKLRGRGAYKIQIEKPDVVLSKMIGSNINFESQQEISKYFGNEFQSKIKSVIARALNESNLELLGIDSRLDEFSEAILPFMKEIVEPYGLTCVSFSVAGLDIEDNELRAKYDEVGMEAISKMRMAQADKAAMQTLGSDWDRMQAANILNNMSQNEGMASFAGNLAMGMASGNAMGQMANQMFGTMNAGVNGGQSAQSQPTQDDPMEKLEKLKKMLDAGLIEQADFDAKKKEILEKM